MVSSDCVEQLKAMKEQWEEGESVRNREMRVIPALMGEL